MSFAIVYEDLSVIRGANQSDWDAAPHRGILAVVIEDVTVGRQIAWGYDFYWWFPVQSGPTGGDLFGMRDYLEEIGSANASADFNKVPLAKLAQDGIKFGRATDNLRMRDALEKAANLEGFAPKSGWLPIENLPPVELGGRT